MSTFYDLPRSSVTVFKADDPSEAFKILFSALKSEKCGFICHEAFTAFHQEFHLNSADGINISEFSNDSEINQDVVTASDVVFADFEVFTMIFGVPRTLQLIKALKSKRRIFIVAPSDFPPPLHLEHMTNATFAIKKTDNAEVFECSTTTFDKKGNVTISDQLITIPSAGAKPIFKTVKKVENPSETSVSIGVPSDQNTGKASMDLPFFVGRQEDGVAIRDAATKKIRVGGQIVYEPDRDDDLDDSDPDDDLNI